MACFVALWPEGWSWPEKGIPRWTPSMTCCATSMWPPIDNSFFGRLTSYARLASAHRVLAASAKRLLRKDRPTEQERRILALTRQAMLSTAELVKCEEADARDVSDSGKLLDVLYCPD